MSGNDWSRFEAELVVEDYLNMLASELAGVRYNKAVRRRALLPRLNARSEQSVEYKHANISAVLLRLGFPYIRGYQPRFNYQRLLAEVVSERLSEERSLHDLAAADAERPIVVPEVDDILSVLTDPPPPAKPDVQTKEPQTWEFRVTNYIEREARNRSLGRAGEEFALNYERARLVRAGKESLAGRVEHTAVVRGDHEGYDILSFEECGAERLIEVKTTKYGRETPFFLSRNEVSVSERETSRYHLYRLFAFRDEPRMYTLAGAMEETCRLSATTFLAVPR